ncbi:MAG: LysE family transporter [Bacteroidia bacterium]|nr:LysE family transporter [Bacteroidia bacterium]
MLETIIKGFVIGILVSAPVGPMGMLAIQRTLSKGRWHGFFTGLGIMCSDLLYAFFSILGVSVFSSFLTNGEKTIQVIGSALLIALGFFLFRAHPLKGWTPQMKPEEIKYHRDFISAFALAIANVGIFFVFITLFARFQFNPIEDGKGKILVAMLSILAGASLWWFSITWLISRVRKHFSRRSLIILNRTVGSILMLIGMGGILLLLIEKLPAI